MQLSMLFENADASAIFVDLDETILSTSKSINKEFFGFRPTGSVEERVKSVREFHTNIRNNLEQMAKEHGVIITNDYLSKLRPHTKRFLEALGSICDLFVLTSGDTEFQSTLLRKFGIIGYFNEVYGRPYSTVPHFDRTVLVDDLGPGTVGIGNKMKLLGVDKDDIRNHLVNVEMWTGNDGDNELMKIIPEVKRKLERQ